MKSSLFKGKIVKIKNDPGINEMVRGKSYLIEDWQINVGGESWTTCKGNPVCMQFAIRTGLQSFETPTNDKVFYGKIGGLGYLVHETEIK